jgi:hypothetical protein
MSIVIYKRHTLLYPDCYNQHSQCHKFYFRSKKETVGNGKKNESINSHCDVKERRGFLFFCHSVYNMVDVRDVDMANKGSYVGVIAQYELGEERNKPRGVAVEL